MYRLGREGPEMVFHGHGESSVYYRMSLTHGDIYEDVHRSIDQVFEAQSTDFIGFSLPQRLHFRARSAAPPPVGNAASCDKTAKGSVLTHLISMAGIVDMDVGRPHTKGTGEGMDDFSHDGAAGMLPSDIVGLDGHHRL